MNDITLNTAEAILELLDKEACAINMTGLVALLPDHPEPEIKRLTNDLYMQGKIQRVRIMGPRGAYYGFFSLFVQTYNGRAAKIEAHEPPPALSAVMTIDQAAAVLERAGWKAEPEMVEVVPAIPFERRAPDRRRLTALEVIKRWRLPYPLGRVVDLIGSSRGQLGRDDAALAIKMLREHVRGDE